ncbi:hypothetical protein HP570_20410 [Brevibacillus sp. RS1.1]|uniref:hypothetical protein n=1 Tax=Brevibacillus sp. RS1.1 TaxID=2738982 RepID=UPI00156BB1F4|nr:hypothetical protein [Brevibacillus sp. RS1.1]NRR04580.1 hypothetical protein [Brevibacillus sp. RS1.1]
MKKKLDTNLRERNKLNEKLNKILLERLLLQEQEKALMLETKKVLNRIKELDCTSSVKKDFSFKSRKTHSHYDYSEIAQLIREILSKTEDGMIWQNVLCNELLKRGITFSNAHVMFKNTLPYLSDVKKEKIGRKIRYTLLTK